jgi:hypothetical protein
MVYLVCFLSLFATHTERYAIGLQHKPHEPLSSHTYDSSIQHLAKNLQAHVVYRLSSSVVVDIPVHVPIALILASRNDVLWYEKDRPIPIQLRGIPNDPLYTQQWYLQNPQEGSIVSNDALIPYENVFEALENVSEQPRVAVLDDGFYLDHPDLNGVFLPGKDFVDNDNNPEASAHDYHGTQVAGVIAARTHNNTGLAGLCPVCQIIPIRLVNQTPSSNAEIRQFFLTGTSIATAFYEAVQGGAWVINNSWGPIDRTPYNAQTPSHYWPLPQVVQEEIGYAVTEGRNGKGVVVVWASGNGGELVTFDRFASDPRVLAIGAVGPDGTAPLYQDYGPPLKFVMPSGGLDPSALAISTTNNPMALEYPAEDYVRTFNGTSASAAVASGFIAALLALHPELTLAQTLETLLETSQKIDPVYAPYNTQGLSSVYGYGKILPQAALQWASSHYSNTLCTNHYELCGNNKDDNCNGIEDNNEPVCQNTCKPSHTGGAACTQDDIDTPCGNETCDGIDNNCNGQTDENFVCTPTEKPLCAPCTNNTSCAAPAICGSVSNLLGTWCVKPCTSSNTCPAPFSSCIAGKCTLSPTSTIRTCRDMEPCALTHTCTQASSCREGVACNGDTTPSPSPSPNNTSEKTSGCSCQSNTWDTSYLLTAFAYMVWRRKYALQCHFYSCLSLYNKQRFF